MSNILEFRTVSLLQNEEIYIEDIQENQYIVKNKSLYSYGRGMEFVRELRNDEYKIIWECVGEILPF